MRKLALGLLLLCTVSGYAREIHYPAVIAKKISASVITFEHCYTEVNCISIGSKDGYDIEDLSFTPRLKKVKAVALGTGELVVGVFGGWVAWATWGAGAAGTMMWTAGVGTGTAITAAPTIIDNLNPVLQWKMANIEALIHKDKFSNDDNIVIEISDEAIMAKFVRTLRKVLSKVRPVN